MAVNKKATMLGALGNGSNGIRSSRQAWERGSMARQYGEAPDPAPDEAAAMASMSSEANTFKRGSTMS